MVSSGYEIETRLPVMEAFYTIQGEGYHQGKAAYFIRLGGCDVGCVWCDVKDSWDAQRHPMKSVDTIVAEAAKEFKAPLPEVINLADELKVVVFNKSDFDWAEKFAGLVPRNCKLFLQPEWDRSQEMTPLIIEYIKQNPKWEFSLQLHKYINVP